MTYEEIIASYPDIKKVNEEMTLGRHSSEQFYRILRRKFAGQNANTETYGVRKDYKGNNVTLEYQKNLIEKLQSDEEFRFKPKHDQQKTNITDAPGFGSVRLSPPFEDPLFDREYFTFLNSLISEEDHVIDFGGGMSPFLYFLNKSRKTLVDKADVPDVMEPLGIKYFDAEKWMTQYYDVQTKVFDSTLFCFHTLEHTDDPESLIRFFSKFTLFVFATPREELIDTSIYHHIYMQVEIFKSLFKQINRPAFLRTSKNHALDIHGIVVNSPAKWNLMKDNPFFKNNFKLFTEF